MNTSGVAQAVNLATRKQLGGSALHFGCAAVPREYGVKGGIVPHRVFIGGDGRVLHNLEGLQGLGTLPRRMPELLSSCRTCATSAEAAATSTGELAPTECAHLDVAERIRGECFANDVPLDAEMLVWSEDELYDHFLSGGGRRPRHHHERGQSTLADIIS